MTTSSKTNTLIYVLFHNHGAYIEQCLRSLEANQAVAEFDIILVDTGSTSVEFERLEEANKRDLPIFKIVGKLPDVIDEIYERYIHRYKFIMRADADDYLADGAISALKSELELDDNVAAVMGNWMIVAEDCRVLGSVISPNPNTGVGFHGACTFLRTSSLVGLRFSDIGVDSQDGFATYLHLFLKSFLIKKIDRLVFYYRRHQLNISNNQDRLRANRIKIIDHFFKQIEPALHPATFVILGEEWEGLCSIDRAFLADIDQKMVIVGQKASLIKRNGEKVEYDVGDGNVLDFLQTLRSKDLASEDLFIINFSKLRENYQKQLLTMFYKTGMIFSGSQLYFGQLIEEDVLGELDGGLENLSDCEGSHRYLVKRLRGLLKMGKQEVNDIKLLCDNYLNTYRSY